MHAAKLSIAITEIMWLVISIGALAIVGLVASLFSKNAIDSAQSRNKESDSEQGAFDDPHSEEYTQ